VAVGVNDSRPESHGTPRTPSGLPRFLLRRLSLALLTLLLVSMLVFVAVQLLPGDLGRTTLGPYASEEQVAALNDRLGANDPAPVRYANWLSRFVRGDWGTSATLRQPVRPLVLDRLGNSLVLAVYALALAVPVAVALGMFAARHRGRPIDVAVSATAVSLLAMPEFVIGTILSIVLAVELGWFPVSAGVPEGAVSLFRELTLPAVVLALALFGSLARVARAATLTVLDADYTRTATLKGLPPRRVLARHVLPNVLPATVAATGAHFGYLVGGIVVVETLFSYPGLGKLLLDSATAHDLAPLEASVLATAIAVMVANVAADVAASALDPRLRRAASW
jgi:peptide/nickel transport system permease protein